MAQQLQAFPHYSSKGRRFTSQNLQGTVNSHNWNSISRKPNTSLLASMGTKYMYGAQT